MKGLTLPTALLLLPAVAGAKPHPPRPAAKARAARTAAAKAIPPAVLATMAAPVPGDAGSAIAIDAASGKVLWSKNPDVPRFPASTTKIMTGLLLAERLKPEEVVTAPWDVALVRESSMHLRPFEKLTARDLLTALMLRSANDGCYAVAVRLAGSVDKFSDMMNARAREIGCTGTHFHNPNGLNDPHHTTTARDLALIGREAMKNPLFASVVGTYKAHIDRSVNKKDEWMTNHNKRLSKDPTCDGIKTGWTVPAGKCFVGSTVRDGWRAITVVLKAKDWQKDTGDLANWAYARYGRRDTVRAGRPVVDAPVSGGALASVPAVPERDAYNLVVRGSAPDRASKTVSLLPVSAPISKGQRVGEIVLRDGDGFEQRVALLAQADVPAAPVAQVVSNVTHPGGGASRFLIGGALVGGWAILRGRSRRRVVGRAYRRA